MLSKVGPFLSVLKKIYLKVAHFKVTQKAVTFSFSSFTFSTRFYFKKGQMLELSVGELDDTFGGFSSKMRLF